MKQKSCSCGSTEFIGHQVCHHEVFVNTDGTFEDNKCIYDSKVPFGPFQCTRCGKEYENLPDDLPEVEVVECSRCNALVPKNKTFLVAGGAILKEEFVCDCCCSPVVETPAVETPAVETKKTSPMASCNVSKDNLSDLSNLIQYRIDDVLTVPVDAEHPELGFYVGLLVVDSFVDGSLEKIVWLKAGQNVNRPGWFDVKDPSEDPA